jgi:hypothetical protein
MKDIDPAADAADRTGMGMKWQIINNIIVFILFN